MNMELVAHKYLTKLRIIAKIPENGQIDTTYNNLDIYTNNIFSWVFRKLQGDGKENTVKYLMDLYKEINSFIEQYIHILTMETNETKKRKKILLVVSLAEKLKDSLIGIHNLAGTYKSYVKITSILECIEHDMIIPQYNEMLKYIPSEYVTESLKTSIINNQYSNEIDLN
jgi:hypothetical protein